MRYDLGKIRLTETEAVYDSDFIELNDSACDSDLQFSLGPKCSYNIPTTAECVWLTLDVTGELACIWGNLPIK